MDDFKPPAAAGQHRLDMLERALRLAGHWIWEQDDQFRFTAIDGDLLTHTGIDVQEHIGKTRWELPALNMTESQWDAHRALLSAYQPFRDLRIQRPDSNGRVHWVSISGEPVFDGQGRFTGYVGYGRDITELRLAQQREQDALARAQADHAQVTAWRERLDLVLRGSNDAAWDRDLVTGEFWLSPRWWEMLGLNEGELPPDATDWQDLMHPLDRPHVDETFRQALRSGSPIFEAEYRMRHASGYWIPMYGRGCILRDANGRGIRTAGTNTDLTSWRRAQAALQTNQVQLELALDAGETALWELDAQGTLMATPRLDEMLKRRPGGPRRGRGSWQARMHPHDRVAAIGAMNDLLENRSERLDQEYRVRRDDGEWIWVHSRARVIERDAQDRPLRVAGTMQDVTDRMRRAEMAQMQQEWLESMLAAVATGIAVHDGVNMVYANAAFRGMLGIEQDEDITALKVDDLLAEDDLPMVMERRRAVADGGVVPVSVVRLRTRGGQVLQAAASLTRLAWKQRVLMASAVIPVNESDMLGVRVREAQRKFERTLVGELERMQADAASELHDSLGSQLAGVSLLLGSVATGLQPHDAASPVLARVRAALEEAMRDLRGVARQLTPVDGHPGSLPGALQQLADQLELDSGLTCRFHDVSGGVTPPREVSNQIYWLAQEALSNAARHSQGNRFELRLSCADDGLRLQVHDNGRGWPADMSRTPGLWRSGIRSMLARAHALDARLEFRSGHLGGACLELIVPLFVLDEHAP